MEEQLGKAIEEATPVGFEAGRSFERNRILGVANGLKITSVIPGKPYPRCGHCGGLLTSTTHATTCKSWNAALQALKEEITK